MSARQDFPAALPGARKDVFYVRDRETSTTNVSLDLVTLYKALGGGWEEVFPDGPVEPDPAAYLPF
jgi:hypothetical protein